MQVIQNSKIQEKIYTEKLTNGLKVIIIPKKTQKKYSKSKQNVHKKYGVHTCAGQLPLGMGPALDRG